MYLEAVFERFTQKGPVTVRSRALMENALAPDALNNIFAEHAEHQYEKNLLFSSLVDLMGAGSLQDSTGSQRCLPCSQGYVAGIAHCGVRQAQRYRR